MRNQVLNYAIKALKKQRKNKEKTKKKGIDFDIYALFLVILSLRSLLRFRPSTSRIIAKGS